VRNYNLKEKTGKFEIGSIMLKKVFIYSFL
jgi:hypothetical protein